MVPRKGYSRKAYDANYETAFPPRRTSQEWCDIHKVFVLDADGWRDDPHVWGQRILETDFMARLNRSTIMHKVEEPRSPDA